MRSRRDVLRAGALAGVAALAGCVADSTETPTDSPTATPTDDPTPTDSPAPDGPTTVAVGPEGRLRFDPETVTVPVGATVRWTFESAGHNVTSKRGASEKVRNPDGTEPFASYEGDSHFAVLDVGEAYEHAFDVAGEYVYVCAPHEDQGMVGTVVVEG